MPQQNYEIRVRGRLGETFRTAFPSLRARTQGNDTVLSGSLVDRAALYGVLAIIETFGLELVELRQVASSELVSVWCAPVNWKSRVKTKHCRRGRSEPRHPVARERSVA